ncbi:hypothetical protein T4A_5715 [Trichinella pseudospiralis]|uniref:Uncharacterized protein n=1 Tax=Trichinella pseudospiralis TaxID=6337 RepID=A0A0V1EG86_TRIPS|nr:hypothetical protein T4A_5715 [Trichinella pseudospiralis]
MLLFNQRINVHDHLTINRKIISLQLAVETSACSYSTAGLPTVPPHHLPTLPDRVHYQHTSVVDQVQRMEHGKTENVFNTKQIPDRTEQNKKTKKANTSSKND